MPWRSYRCRHRRPQSIFPAAGQALAGAFRSHAGRLCEPGNIARRWCRRDSRTPSEMRRILPDVPVKSNLVIVTIAMNADAFWDAHKRLRSAPGCRIIAVKFSAWQHLLVSWLWRACTAQAKLLSRKCSARGSTLRCSISLQSLDGFDRMRNWT